MTRSNPGANSSYISRRRPWYAAFQAIGLPLSPSTPFPPPSAVKQGPSHWSSLEGPPRAKFLGSHPSVNEG